MPWSMQTWLPAPSWNRGGRYWRQWLSVSGTTSCWQTGTWTAPPCARLCSRNPSSASGWNSSPTRLEGSQRNLCDRVLVIDAPESLQIQRTADRDGNTEEQVLRIMAAQMGRKEHLALADHVIVNDGGLEDLHRQVEAVHMEILATLKSP